MIRQAERLTDLTLVLPTGAGLGRRIMQNLARIGCAIRQARTEWRYEKAMHDALADLDDRQRRDLGVDRGAL